MSKGLEIRAEIDTETVRALLLLNGGGALALLTLFSALVDKHAYKPLVTAILISVLILMLGLVCAVLHNRFRRKCSLKHDQHNMSPPADMLLGFNLGKPMVCWVSERLMHASILCFILAGSYVAIVGIRTVEHQSEPVAAQGTSITLPRE